MSSLMNLLARAAPWAFKNGKLTWATGFVIACLLPILLVLFLFRHWLGLDNLWAEGQIGIATVLGLLGMIGVSIGLMALVFYSNRSGMDDRVNDTHETKDPTKR